MTLILFASGIGKFLVTRIWWAVIPTSPYIIEHYRHSPGDCAFSSTENTSTIRVRVRVQFDCSIDRVYYMLSWTYRHRFSFCRREKSLYHNCSALLRTDTACNLNTSPPPTPLCLGRSSLSDVIVNSLTFFFRLYKVDSPAECLAPSDDQHINNNVVVFLSLLQAHCRVHPSNCAVSLSQAYRGPSR